FGSASSAWPGLPGTLLRDRVSGQGSGSAGSARAQNPGRQREKSRSADVATEREPEAGDRPIAATIALADRRPRNHHGRIQVGQRRGVVGERRITEYERGIGDGKGRAAIHQRGTDHAERGDAEPQRRIELGEQRFAQSAGPGGYSGGDGQ